MVQTRTTDGGNSLRRYWLHGKRTNGRTGTAQRDPESVLNYSQLYANGKPGWCLKHQPGNPRRRCYPCQGAANKEEGFSERVNADKKYSDLPKKSVDFVPVLW